MDATESNIKQLHRKVDTNAHIRKMPLQYSYSKSYFFYPRVSFAGSMHSFTRARQTRSFRVSYANIQAPLVIALDSYRRFVPQSAINCTVSFALQHLHPALRYYHAHSASVCRTVFASVAHQAACQACLCLAMPWLVPGSERAWSALSPKVEDVDPQSPRTTASSSE